MTFLKWRVPKGRRCLYVDGELPASDLQERVKSICANGAPSGLEFISSEFFFDSEGKPMMLNSEEHQKRFLLLLADLEILGRRPEVIVLDNISALCFGLDENSNSDQDLFLQFLLQLRHQKYTVVVLHHTGKSGDQRGASRREDFLDLSIKLVDPEEPSTTGNAKFVMQFTKTRRKITHGCDLECELITGQDGNLEWATSEVATTKPQKWVACLKFIAAEAPRNQVEIAEHFKVKPGTVSKYVAKAREKNLLDENSLTVTSGGEKYLRKVYGNAKSEDE